MRGCTRKFHFNFLSQKLFFFLLHVNCYIRNQNIFLYPREISPTNY